MRHTLQKRISTFQHHMHNILPKRHFQSTEQQDVLFHAGGTNPDLMVRGSAQCPMKSNATLPESVDLLAITFHPEQTLKSKMKRIITGFFSLTLLMLFVLGLPAVSSAAVSLLPRLLGH